VLFRSLKLYDGNGELIGDLKMKYGKPGDVFWVREKFTPLPFDMVNQITGLHFSYYADCDADSLELAKEYGFKWKPSIHMPKEAARIFLKIKHVRVERLNQISRRDCVLEGCPIPIPSGKTNPKAWFYDLWTDINGMNSWLSNPYVWVIEFERIDKPENF